MGTIVIDGKTFKGNNVTIRNGAVIIDGASQPGILTGVVEIKITEGTISRLDTDASVTCGDVAGQVSAGGSVSCNNVGGSVNAGGSVRIG
jgi:hypothetical protein